MRARGVRHVPPVGLRRPVGVRRQNAGAGVGGPARVAGVNDGDGGPARGQLVGQREPHQAAPGDGDVTVVPVHARAG